MLLIREEKGTIWPNENNVLKNEKKSSLYLKQILKINVKQIARLIGLRRGKQRRIKRNL